MPRPKKCRRVCAMPRCSSFGPLEGEGSEPVGMALEEYETIRLIDLLGCTQEECAGQMGVSRTTVTEMYERAREKIADCLVNGKALRICGGHYGVCDGSPRGRCGGSC